MSRWSSLLVLILLSLFVLSCKKNSNEEQYLMNIDGKLLSVEDDQGIPFGTVFLLSAEDIGLDAIWYGNSYTVHSEYKTDINGKFTIQFIRHLDSNYSLSAEADGFFSNHNTGGGFIRPNWLSAASGQQPISRYMAVKLIPCGWVRVKLSKVPPYNESRIVHLYTLKTQGCEYRFGGQGIQDTTIVFGPKWAATDLEIAYRVNTNGFMGALITDTVFLTAHDTIEYHIKF